MTRALHRLHTDERGSVLFFVVFFLPVALAIAAFVIDGSNLFEHRRHLQMQADAGALAASHEFQHCFIDADAANTSIEAAALSYSGDDYNAQIGASDAQTRVEQRINAASWTEDSFTDGPPCDTGYVDVKLTEKDSPAFFPFIPSNDVHAHARVQIFTIRQSNKLLPIAVPDPDPKVARAFFVDESKPVTDPNYVIKSVPLERNGSSGGLALWDNSGAHPDDGAIPVDVPINADHVGVRIALGGHTSTTCGALLVDCYDTQSTHGLVHIQGWNNSGTGAPKTPLTRSVTLTPGTCAIPPYFVDPAASCTVGVTAKVDFGASPTVLQATLTAHVGATNLPMTFNAGTGLWTTTGTAAVTAQTGPQDVTFNWTINKNADGTNCTPNNSCRGNLAAAQRVFSAMADRSGPISLAKVTDAVTGLPANSVERCSSVQTSCTKSLVVTIGIKGGLALTDLDDPPVRLRIIGGSQNQSLDCDPDVSNLGTELYQGCAPTYTPFVGPNACPGTASALWAKPNPPAWECVAIQTGNATNQIAAGLNHRILGAEKPSSCTHPNNWPNYEAGDPRIIFVLVTPFGAFSGSGSNTVPIMRFAAFYVTGWTGQGSGFDNPCLGQGDEMPTNPAEIVGRFIKYVDPLNEGEPGDEECDFGALEPCVAVLVE